MSDFGLLFGCGALNLNYLLQLMDDFIGIGMGLLGYVPFRLQYASILRLGLLKKLSFIKYA